MQGFKNILGRFRAIYKGFFKEPDVTPETLSERRYICSKCPWNSRNYEGQLPLINRLQKKLNKPFCTACGCFIYEKTKVASENCGLLEQGEEPLWRAVDSLKEKKSR